MTTNSSAGPRRTAISPDNDPIGQIPPENLRGILASAADLSVMISPEAVILSLVVNPRCADLGNLDHWVGRPLRDFLTRESVPKFDALLDRAAKGTLTNRPVELNHRDNAVWDFPIQYTLHEVSHGGGFLLLGRDLRPVAETQRQLIQAQMALERGYEAQREFDSRYRLLLATVTDAIVLVSLGDGRITDLNDLAAGLLGAGRKDLVGAVFATQFDGLRRSDVATRLTEAAMSERAGAVELKVERTGEAVTVHPEVFRVSGDRVAICRIARGAGPGPAASGGLSRAIEAFYGAATEAILFTDARGTIRSANDRFLAMIDAAHLSDVKGRSLAEFLARGQVDFGVLSENAVRAGHVRLYATEFVSDYGTRMAVEVSAASLPDNGEATLAFVARDAGRVDSVRLSAQQADTPAQQNIVELVGSASLKEIVAETNDVIEKLCIETAIRLTNNNRVAAAEMLGLSRQSLYVKLRKYDLVKRTDED